MVRNYMKIAFRNLLKFKGYTAINLLGLSVGLAAGMLILTHVIDETSFDQFHKNGERIYRVGTGFVDLKTGEDSGGYDANGWPLGKVLITNYPEVEEVVYIRNASGLDVNFEGKRIEERPYYTDESFFKTFSFPLVNGNAQTSLKDPYSVVISESLAEKYFGSQPAYGKSLLLGDSLNFIVKGVMKDVPANSHMQFNMLVSFSTYKILNPNFSFDYGWGNINMRNYVLVKEGIDHASFKEKVKNTYMDQAGEQFQNWGMHATVVLDNLSDVYLTSEIGNGMGPQGDMGRLYLLIAVAAFVILLACINFINLSTARSVYRAKEVGLRKVVGSSRAALIGQFLIESLFITLLSFFIAVILIDLFLPLFNELLGKSYSLASIFSKEMFIGTVSLIAFITLLAGYYPAVLISGSKPAQVLKGKLHTSRKGIALRRALVVFQFFVSSGLVIATFVVINQLQYMRFANVGFDKEQVLIINTSGISSGERGKLQGAIKNDISSISGVQKVSYTNAYPGRHGWSGQIAFPEGATESGESISVEYIAIDENYVDVLDLELMAGHSFDPDNAAAMADGLILNETAVARFGWDTAENAIGKGITSPSGHPEGTVIGVVKDYHHYGLQQKMQPIVLDVSPENSYYYLVKFNTSNASELVAAIEKLWNTHFDSYEYHYYFLDDQFDKQYHSEKRLGKVFLIFAITTILIAIVGLVGLMSFIVVLRSKEIGVRKILGARTINITTVLSKEFIGLVIIGNIIAIPLLWYVAGEWLSNFAYRTEVSPLLFIYTFLTTIGVAVLTMFLQTIKAGRMNPVDVLKDE